MRTSTNVTSATSATRNWTTAGFSPFSAASMRDFSELTTRAPASSSPSPGGIIARASAPEQRADDVASPAGRSAPPRWRRRGDRGGRAPPARGWGCGGRRCRASRAASPRRAAARPWSASSAGRANSENVTAADTGLPGSPNTRRPPSVPNQVGLPGCSATPQNTSSTPSAASAGLTWSWGPTDTPPETTTTLGALERLAERGLGDRAVVGKPRASRRRSRRSWSPAPRASARWSCGSRPGPAARRARAAHRRCTGPRRAACARRRPSPRPRRTAAPSSTAPSRRARAEHERPDAMSSPARRTFSPSPRRRRSSRS